MKGYQAVMGVTQVTDENGSKSGDEGDGLLGIYFEMEFVVSMD